TPLLKQPAGDVKADETGRAGDENVVDHDQSRQSSTPAGFALRSSRHLTSSTTPSLPLSSPVTNGQPPRTYSSCATAKITASAGASASSARSAMPYSCSASRDD